MPKQNFRRTVVIKSYVKIFLTKIKKTIYLIIKYIILFQLIPTNGSLKAENCNVLTSRRI